MSQRNRDIRSKLGAKSTCSGRANAEMPSALARKINFGEPEESREQHDYVKLSKVIFENPSKIQERESAESFDYRIVE